MFLEDTVNPLLESIPVPKPPIGPRLGSEPEYWMGRNWRAFAHPDEGTVSVNRGASPFALGHEIGHVLDKNVGTPGAMDLAGEVKNIRKHQLYEMMRGSDELPEALDERLVFDTNTNPWEMHHSKGDAKKFWIAQVGSRAF